MFFIIFIVLKIFNFDGYVYIICFDLFYIKFSCLKFFGKKIFCFKRGV